MVSGGGHSINAGLQATPTAFTGRWDGSLHLVSPHFSAVNFFGQKLTSLGRSCSLDGAVFAQESTFFVIKWHFQASTTGNKVPGWYFTQLLLCSASVSASYMYYVFEVTS